MRSTARRRSAARTSPTLFRRISAWGSALFLLAAAGSDLAESKSKYRIVPGPAVISEEERRIVADPNTGSEHAVILLEETDQDDDISVLSKTAYHLRAKILSNEGRGLANVEIPLLAKEGSVKEWWGRTLLPGGGVLELPAEDLKEQMAVRSGRRREIRIVKAVLPGVVPGAVIDYGYVVRDVNAAGLRRVPLQRAWPMKEFRYRWVPWSLMSAVRPRNSACTLSRALGLHVEAARQKKWFLVTGKDLPPVVREPMAPPDDEMRATAVFYYTFYARNPGDFWDTVATEWDRLAALFCKPERVIDRTLQEMSFPPGADLETKLRVAYEWLAGRVRNTLLGSSEEMETLARRDEAESLREGAAGVLERGEANAWQIDLVFIGMARALGAEAYLVLACDRREHEWNPSLLALDQFDEGVVAVRAPSDPPGKITLADPGSGLPYGEIPSWVAGGRALLASPKGGREIVLPRSEARQNVSETRAVIAIDPSARIAKVRWSRSGSGQKGLVERRALRQLAPAERRKRMEGLCGASGDFEVLRAEAPQIDDPTAGLRLECEGESALRNGRGEESSISLHFGGVWIEEVPALTSPSRAHPVVLPFAGVDRAGLEIASPAGFRPDAPPEAVRIESSFGVYTLAIATTDSGFHIDRSLTLSQTEIAPESYDALRRFLEEVRLADRTPIAFTRSEGDSR